MSNRGKGYTTPRVRSSIRKPPSVKKEYKMRQRTKEIDFKSLERLRKSFKCVQTKINSLENVDRNMAIDERYIGDKFPFQFPLYPFGTFLGDGKTGIEEF